MTKEKLEFEQYRDWLLENNPANEKPWNPPLNKEEKELLKDPLIEEDPYLKKNNIKIIAYNLAQIRESNNQRNLSSSLEWLIKTNNNIKNEKISPRGLTIYQLLEKHGNVLNKTIDNLIVKSKQRKEKLLSNLEKWSMVDDVWVNFNTKEEMPFIFLSKDDCQEAKRTVVNGIKQNPQQWKFEEKENKQDLNLWDLIHAWKIGKSIKGETIKLVVNKNARIGYTESSFSVEELKEIEQVLSRQQTQQVEQSKSWFPFRGDNSGEY